jgi:hypothetical protein
VRRRLESFRKPLDLTLQDDEYEAMIKQYSSALLQVCIQTQSLESIKNSSSAMASSCQMSIIALELLLHQQVNV